jgi:endonuclease YncB( thermonuclease family)
MFVALSSLIKAVIVSLIVSVFASLHLDVPRTIIEDVVQAGWQIPKKTQATSSSTTYTVVTVIDGDTFTVATATSSITVRVLGIDTPETKFSPSGEECYGAEASEKARALLAGKTVTLTTDSAQDTYDKHGRLLAYVQVEDAFDFGDTMIREGYAKEYTYAGFYTQQARYCAAEQDAKNTKKGLWGICNK